MSAEGGAKLYLPYGSGKVTLTSRYGWRNLNGVRDYHKGIDLVGEDKAIVAPCDGVVGASAMLDERSDATLTWQWGNFVRVDADGGGMSVFLCHMAKRLVSVGDRVRAGDAIGIEGNTGYSFGSHCHFEVRERGVSVDPTPYLGIENGWGEYDAGKQWKGEGEMKDWWEEPLAWAQENGIIYGDENGELHLDKPCTRKQMLVFLYRLYRLLSRNGG